jgi:hypothetical protein
MLRDQADGAAVPQPPAFPQFSASPMPDILVARTARLRHAVYLEVTAGNVPAQIRRDGASGTRRHHTVDRDGGDHPNPAEFAVAAERAASARAASIVSAHTASQIVSIVTVLAADQPRPLPSPWPSCPTR